MNVVHRVTGYDRETEFLDREFEVPHDRLAEIREIARVPVPSGEEQVGCFLLDRAAAAAIADRFAFAMNLDRYDWFLEPIAVE